MGIFSFIQAVASTVGSGTSNSVTINGVGAGHLLIAVPTISCGANTASNVVVSDGVNNWSTSKICGPFTPASVNQYIASAWAQNVVGGNTTVTETWTVSGGTPGIEVIVAEFSYTPGNIIQPHFSQFIQASSATSSTISVPSINPPATGSLLVTFTNNSGGNLTPHSPWVSAGGNGALAYNLHSDNPSVPLNISDATSPDTWQTIIIDFYNQEYDAITG